MERVNIKVSGSVQGVLYRSDTASIAQKLGLVGWVKNMPDGSVEIVAEGDNEELGKLIQWCWQGPSFAKVEDVKLKWQKAKGEFRDFDITY
ncbi:MAG: acylphosphatase [Candidatus Woykebacteria bacterium]